MKRTEHVEQREFVQWVRQYTPFLIYAIPNGGARGRSQGATLKAEGVLAGMPDLHIPELRLWIEMKASGGKVSPVAMSFNPTVAAISPAKTDSISSLLSA